MYLLTITGVNISMHVCNGNSSYSVLGVTVFESCDCDDSNMKADGSCCQSKTIVLEQNITDNYAPKDCTESQFKIYDLVAFPNLVVESNYSNTNSFAYPILSPIQQQHSSLFILNRVMRI
jgi:hypothetical protein